MKIEDLTGGREPEERHSPSSGNTNHPVYKNRYQFEDELLEDALALKKAEGDKFSTSLMQRRLGIGYPRAARLREMMDEIKKESIMAPTHDSHNYKEDYIKAGTVVVDLLVNSIRIEGELRVIMEEHPELFLGQTFKALYREWEKSRSKAERFLRDCNGK